MPQGQANSHLYDILFQCLLNASGLSNLTDPFKLYMPSPSELTIFVPLLFFFFSSTSTLMIEC